MFRIFASNALRNKDHKQRRPILSTGYMICSLALLYIFAYSYFRHARARDPTSYFFDSRHAYTQVYSKARIEQADAYIKRMNEESPVTNVGHGPPKICIGVATVARRERQYVSTNIGSLLEGLSNFERETVFMNVLLAHSDPNKHPNANDPWLTNLAGRVLHYDQGSPDYETIVAWEEAGSYRNKTIYDYTLLMRDRYDTGAEYVAMIEDDTLAARGWYQHTLDALEIVSRKNSQSGERWAYLRLFYVEDLLGWNSEEWPRYLFWSLVTWATLTTAMLYVKKKTRSLGQTDFISYECIGITSIVFTPLVIALCFMAGRQTVWSISSGVQRMNRYGCCSQALVYPRSIIPLILARSDLTTDWLVDMMIEKIADKENLQRWATVPALFQHIGTTSSKGYGFDDNARELWNFRFETAYQP